MENQNQSLEWYVKLRKDLKTLIKKGESKYVRLHWEIGKRIVQDILKFKKPKYGSKSIENLAKDLGISKTQLYYSLSFFKKYPDYETFEKSDGKKSWREVRKSFPKKKKASKVSQTTLLKEEIELMKSEEIEKLEGILTKTIKSLTEQQKEFTTRGFKVIPSRISRIVDYTSLFYKEIKETKDLKKKGT